MGVKVDGQELSRSATNLVEYFKETTGYNDSARVVEEAIFTIWELVKIERSRSKTEPTLPASEVLGTIKSFMRFKGDEKRIEFEY